MEERGRHIIIRINTRDVWKALKFASDEYIVLEYHEEDAKYVRSSPNSKLNHENVEGLQKFYDKYFDEITTILPNGEDEEG